MARIYVGHLPMDIKESELDDLFYKYGRIRDIDIKHPLKPPAYAFVSFEDSRDAEDAVRGKDGTSFAGQRLRCEIAKGDRRDRDGGRDRDRRGGDERKRGGRGRRTDYEIIVTNLPRGCSWQDLKDFARKAGDVVYADVDRYGEGVVDYANRDDMEHALKTLDDTELKSRGETSHVRLKPVRRRGYSEDRSRSRSRERKDRRDRDRDRSRSADRSRSPSNASKASNRSHSEERDRSRERGRRSPSRSPSPGANKKDDARDRDREDDRRDDDR